MMTDEELATVRTMVKSSAHSILLTAEIGKLFIDGMKEQNLPPEIVRAVYHYVADKLSGK